MDFMLMCLTIFLTIFLKLNLIAFMILFILAMIGTNAQGDNVIWDKYHEYYRRFIIKKGKSIKKVKFTFLHFNIYLATLYLSIFYFIFS